MKKLLYMLFAFFTLFISACKTDNVSKISRREKAIGECCKELSGDNPKPANVPKKEKNQTQERKTNVSYTLPAYFWDTKSMIW